MPRKDPEARKAYQLEYAAKHKAALTKYRAEYREKNKELIRAKKKIAWQVNLEQNRLKLKQRYANDPAYWQQKARENYIKNKEKGQEYAKRYRENNYVLVKVKKKQYRTLNKHVVNAAVARRKSAKIQRTPAWLTDDDKWLIIEIYELAAIRTKMFGFDWHVDHIIPLQGKIVSGLHVPQNMRVIPAILNVKKKNTYRIDHGK